MKAAVYYGEHDIRVESVAEPSGLGPRQLLLRPAWCGICGTDLHEFAEGPIVIPSEPHPLNGSVLPQILGHEFSAEVLETGGEVENAAPGDRVSVMPLIVCGHCDYCVRGLNHLCVKMACTGLSSEWGGISGLAVVEDYQVARLPETVDDVQGALIEPAAMAAYGVDRAGLSGGQTALVTGVGPIGALAALYTAACGLDVIIAEPNPNRATFAEGLDVGTVIDPRQAGAAERIRDLTGGNGVDATIECSGNAAALNLGIEVTRSRGAVVQTGLNTGPTSIDPMQVSLKDLSIIGTWCYPIYDWPRVIGLVAGGRFPVEKVVSRRIDSEDVVPAGFEALLDPEGDEMKVLVSV